MAKRRTVWGLACVLVISAAWTSAAAERPVRKSQTPRVCVGTFDSRAVALAHFGKMMRDGWLEGLRAEHAKAKAAGDEKLVRQLEAKGQSRQERLHRQVFGTAPVDDALETIKEDIPKLARSAGVDVVVCLHDMVYQGPSAEFVDITDQMVQLFDPDEETLKKIQAILKHPPVPDEVLENMECHGPEK